MYRHMYMFTENPICSLKQLFTVTSVDRRYFCSQKGKWIGGIAENAAAVYKSAAVTHSPINFGGRSIDHNVLFCSLVFLPAAFDSIRGCGESIYLSRCHEPPVMDGGCSLTLTPKGEAVPRTYPVPATLCFWSWFLSAVFFLLHALFLLFPSHGIRKVANKVVYVSSHAISRNTFSRLIARLSDLKYHLWYSAYKYCLLKYSILWYKKYYCKFLPMQFIFDDGKIAIPCEKAR